MTAFIIANLAPIMFATLVVVLLLGYPAAFSLGAVGLFFAIIGVELGQFHPDFLQALPERSSTSPMKVKKGMASSVSLFITP